MASSSNDGVVNDEEAARDSKILEFQEICAVDDRNVAVLFLDRFNWDLQVAVQEYLAERDGGEPSAGFSPEHQQNLENRRQERQTGAVSNANRQTQTIGWGQWGWALISLPFRFFYSSFYDIFRFFYRFVFIPGRAIGDPVADVERFIIDYESKYGPNHPVFYRGSYSQAVNDAKKEFRFLVVYLHSDTHRDTDKFCRSTLGSQNVINFINTNALFWACSVRLSEGFRVSQAMRETTYPFMALVAMRENRMMIVLRQEGICVARVLVDMLTAAIADNQVYVNLARQEKQQQQMNQVIRQEQEHAFQESLKQDREKERRRAEEQKLKEAEIEENLRREQNERDRKEDLAKQKEEIRRNLPAEPDSADPDCVRVRLTFPSGAKLERRFKSSDSLQLLRSVTMCHPDCPDNFSIVNGYPRKVLACESNQWEDHSSTNRVPTFADEGLLRSVTLIIQNNEA